MNGIGGKNGRRSAEVGCPPIRRMEDFMRDASQSAPRGEIVRLWRDAFAEDSLEDIDRFLDEAAFPDGGLVWMEDGRPVSMTFTLSAELIAGGRALPVQYIYAAATLTPWRGRGLFGRLLRESHRLAAAEGVAASFLRPANSGLFEYYARFGYHPYFYVKEVTETAVAAAAESGQPQTAGMPAANTAAPAAYAAAPAAYAAAPAAYAAGRNAALADWPVWIRWPERLLRFAADSAAAEGGGCFCSPDGCVLAGEGEPRLIKERLVTGDAGRLAAAIGKAFPFTQAKIRIPAGSRETSVPFGMLCPLGEGAGLLRHAAAEGRLPYMGPALD